MSRSRRKKVGRKKNSNSVGRIKESNFINCPEAGLLNFKTETIRNGMFMFDSIGFTAKDMENKIYEIRGLLFDQEKGWYEADALIPKYYGKDVYEACIEYAADRALNDHILLLVALFGQKRPADFAMMINRDEIVRRLDSRGCLVLNK